MKIFTKSNHTLTHSLRYNIQIRLKFKETTGESCLRLVAGCWIRYEGRMHTLLDACMPACHLEVLPSPRRDRRLGGVGSARTQSHCHTGQSRRGRGKQQSQRAQYNALSTATRCHPLPLVSPRSLSLFPPNSIPLQQSSVPLVLFPLSSSVHFPTYLSPHRPIHPINIANRHTHR